MDVTVKTEKTEVDETSKTEEAGIEKNVKVEKTEEANAACCTNMDVTVKTEKTEVDETSKTEEAGIENNVKVEKTEDANVACCKNMDETIKTEKAEVDHTSKTEEAGIEKNATVEKTEDANGTEDAATTPLELQIIRQVEYYFGDINLPRDRFLQDQIKEDDGWVTLETMLKFNRLKRFSDDKSFICASLEKSTSGLIEISEDKIKIRRSPDVPIPENTKERRDELMKRSAYAKGFPLDLTLDQLQDFFKPHGKTDYIQMRRIPKTRNFKGSVFVVFGDENDAEKFVKAESLKYEDEELVRHFKDDYFKKKTDERKKLKAQNSGQETEKEKEHDEKIKERVKLATILRLDGLPENILIEDIRNFFTDFGKVAWVDHDKGETKGYVRFADENEATKVLEQAKEAGDGKIEINNNEIQARVLDGEEEMNHWRMIFKTQEEQRRNKAKGRRRNDRYGSGHKGGKKRSFGERRERGGGEPKAKQAKSEAADT